MTYTTKSHLRIFPFLALMAFLLPIIVGLFGTWLPAFGYLPAIGATSFSIEPFQEFFYHPSTPKAITSTLISGVGAPIIALAITLWITITVYGTSLWQFLTRMLAPLLAIPHASFAIGFTFLIAPSGWIIRLISPEISGFTSPPDLSTVKDPLAISLTLALALKEIPFLLLMCISALNQIDVRRTKWIGGSLGYHNFRIWSRLIIPQIYPQLRLPLLAVLAYSLSVVDVSMILGPTLPPTLAVLINRWFNDPEITTRLMGAAGATFLFGLVALIISFFLLIERVWRSHFLKKMTDGRRESPLDRFRFTGSIISGALLSTTLLSLVSLVFWSCTKSWRFPDTMPSSFTFAFWEKGLVGASSPIITTVIVGIIATIIAIILVLGCLEYEVTLAKSGKKDNSQKMIWILYLPLLIPQISFLFGVQTAAILFHLEGHWLSLIGSHLIFVLPYVFLTISQVYRNYDERYMHVATSLSGSTLLSYFCVKLPMLMKPIAFSMATGFSVSVVQYLPTLYIGAGRFATITTETVSLSSGSDRRIIAVYALLQFTVPVCIYLLAILLPAQLFKNRKGMQN